MTKKHAKTGLNALIQQLNDPDWLVRYGAVEKLEKKGAPAVPVLIRTMLTDSNECVRIWAAGALGMIKDPSAMLALIKALGDETGTVRSVAGSALIVTEYELTSGYKGQKSMLAKLIGEKKLDYELAKQFDLDTLRKILIEFVKMLRKKDRSRDAGPKMKKIEYGLAEVYNRVAAFIAKKGKGISVEGGELLKATVKPPKGPDMYRAVGQRSMRLT